MKDLLLKIWEKVTTSWKTSIAGIFVAVLGYLKMTNHIDDNLFNLLMTIGIAVGLLSAKDSNVTGGTQSR